MNHAFTFMERAVGLFLLLAFLAVLVVVMAVGRGQNWFRAHNEYYALYREGYNLSPGVKVKLMHTDIGQVTDVELTEKNLVRVTMRILATYAGRIRADSKAAIESPTFIGSEFINILPGAAEAAVIPAGGQIPSKEQKKIGEYLEEFDFEHKLLKVEQILESTSNIAYVLEHPNGPLLGTLSNIQRLTGDLAAGKGTVGRIVQDDELYRKLLADLERVATILETTNKAVQDLRQTAQAATAVTKDVKEMTGQVKKDVPQVVTRVETILGELEKISRQLEKAMNEAPEISDEARRGMRQVNEILHSVRQNFLIRSNLPQPPVPESHGIQLRGD